MDELLSQLIERRDKLNVAIAALGGEAGVSRTTTKRVAAPAANNARSEAMRRAWEARRARETQPQASVEPAPATEAAPATAEPAPSEAPAATDKKKGRGKS